MCSFPLEYCEFGSSFTKCKETLLEEDPALYEKYYSEGMCIVFANAKKSERLR